MAHDTLPKPPRRDRKEADLTHLETGADILLVCSVLLDPPDAWRCLDGLPLASGRMVEAIAFPEHLSPVASTNAGRPVLVIENNCELLRANAVPLQNLPTEKLQVRLSAVGLANIGEGLRC